MQVHKDHDEFHCPFNKKNKSKAKKTFLIKKNSGKEKIDKRIAFAYKDLESIRENNKNIIENHLKYGVTLNEDIMKSFTNSLKTGNNSKINIHLFESSFNLLSYCNDFLNNFHGNLSNHFIDTSNSIKNFYSLGEFKV